MGMKTWLVGVDLAKTQDYTAISIVEAERVNLGAPVYSILALDRIKGVDYPKIEELLVNTLVRLREACRTKAGVRTHSGPHLCMDASGIGSPIRDYLKARPGLFNGADRRIFPVVFTGGEGAKHDNQTQNFNISKNRMVANFSSLMQHRRIQYPDGLPNLQLLLSEIENFKYKLTESGHASYNAAEGKHDDLVCSLLIPLAVYEIFLYQRIAKVSAKPSWM